MKINNVLISGNQGFIGKYLCSRLTRIGIKCDNRIIGHDITDTSFFEYIDNIQLIVHLAAKTSIKNSFLNPYEMYHNHLLGTLNLLEFARLKNVKKFIYASTYVYGQPKYLPIDEKHPVKPHTPYNESKLMAEELCKSYSCLFNIDMVILRPFYVYGPNARIESFVSSVIQQIKRRHQVKLSGKNTKRDFLFVSDFVDLLIKIMNDFPKGCDLYNVGYGLSYSLEEITRKIGRLLKIEPEIVYDTVIRPADVTEMNADISKVSKRFNWIPKVSIEEGLELSISNANH